MYLVGAPHRHKTDAQILLERSIAAGRRLVTDAEVLQEILHRYAAINRHDAIEPALSALLGVVDEVYPVEKDDVLRASGILRGAAALSARDALHVTIMERHSVSSIMTFDASFDRWPGINRLHEV